MITQPEVEENHDLIEAKIPSQDLDLFLVLLLNYENCTFELIACEFLPAFL